MAIASPIERGKRLRVRAFICYGQELDIEDLLDVEVARLIDAYQVDRLTASLLKEPFPSSGTPCS